MRQVVVRRFEDWRTEARQLLRAGVTPAEVMFVESAGLLGEAEPLVAGAPVSVPREFLELAAVAARFRDAERWDVLYRVLYRVTHGEGHLLRVDIDDDVRRLRVMEKAVRRDMHKMTAFVRFREVRTEEGPHYIAWHRPDHDILRATAPFFVRRFGAMRWTILTPEDSAYWDTRELRFGPGAPRASAPAGDELEQLWRAYYGSIFNPARLNLAAMTNEMPVRHWATLPETDILTELLLGAEGRVAMMIEKQAPSARAWVPDSLELPILQAAAQGCQGCGIYRCATQAVFGEGPSDARVVMVGEQPGDQEDVAGRPFVGPAGVLLDRALAEARIDRKAVYVTNAVKHFKFTERGKRRIHEKPAGAEISACRPWLEKELEAIRPELIVCLGATAAQSLMGRDFRITADRGRLFPTRWAKNLLATVHPSAILRMPDEGRQREEYALFVRDLEVVSSIYPAVG